MAKRRPKTDALAPTGGEDYDGLVAGLSGLLDRARAAAARVVNGVMAATYYELGRRIVEFEQGGKAPRRVRRGVLKRLGTDLSAKLRARDSPAETSNRCGSSTWLGNSPSRVWPVSTPLQSRRRDGWRVQKRQTPSALLPKPFRAKLSPYRGRTTSA